METVLLTHEKERGITINTSHVEYETRAPSEVFLALNSSPKVFNIKSKLSFFSITIIAPRKSSFKKIYYNFKRKSTFHFQLIPI